MARYSVGTKVRIKAGQWGRHAHSDVWKYENRIGEIVGSTFLIGYVIRYWERGEEGQAESILTYTVRLQEGTEIENLLEDSLQRLEIL
jgi:hypothetical protein